MEEQSIRVLLIEDNPGDARLIREALGETTTAQFDLEVADSLAAGLARITTGFDVILLDLSLSDAFGIATFRQVHEAAPQVPIVVLTGNDDDALAVSAVNEGAQDFLSKGRADGELLVRSIRYSIERHRLLDRMRQMATVDELTGLANRRGFALLCQHEFEMALRRRRQLPFLFIDLDRFKSVNDRFGHQEGDRALVAASEVLLQTFRKADVIGRVGGDEFAVLLADASAEGAEPATRRLQANLQASNAMGRRRYQLAMSVGVAIYDPDRPRSLEELMKQADQAMYLEKAERRRTGT